MIKPLEQLAHEQSLRPTVPRIRAGSVYCYVGEDLVDTTDTKVKGWRLTRPTPDRNP